VQPQVRRSRPPPLQTRGHGRWRSSWARDLITDDCVFEATSPAPDGTRHVGRQAVLEACRVFFAGSPTTHFEVEEMFGAGDRVVVR
jgi:hypothetical protein